MMEEHPIPQEVSTYEFRLVGDMTIKQFMQVAAGALISLVLYSSGLAPYVKWPLIIISFLSGIALAFFPIEDRPLSKWIVLFMKAIYSPTIYVWDKNARKYEFFQPEPVEKPMATPTTTPSPATSPQEALQAQALNVSTAPAEDGSDELEKKEQEFLNKVSTQFNSQTSLSQTPVISATPAAPLPAQQVTPPQENTGKGREINVPEAPKIKIEIQPKQETAPISPKLSTQTSVGEQITPIAGQKLTGVKAATFSQEASPPSPPTRPNVIVGQVLSSDGKILDGAILEVKDSEGRPVRALRSNRLGHFMIVTPLVNGKYRITTEKEGFIFDPVSFEANDQIIPPIAIWAKT